MAELARNGTGVFMTMVSSGANLIEKTMAVPLGVMRALRDEAFNAVTASVDWTEGMNQSAFKIVREMMKRFDQLSLAAVDGLDSVAGSLTRAVRESGVAAGEMVSKTAASLTEAQEPASKQMVVPAA